MKKTSKHMWTAAVSLLLCAVLALCPLAETAVWSGYRGGEDGGVTAAKTPRSAEEAELSWALALKAADDWMTAVSEPVLTDEALYVAVGSELRKVSLAGEVTATATLGAPIDYTCRPVYTSGMVLVPESGGALEAVDTATMQVRWTTAGPDTQDGNGDAEVHQSLSTLTVDGGIVYMATTVADWTASYRGIIRAVDTTDGRVVWEYDNTAAGYYWSGAAVIGDAMFIAGDDGVLLSLDKAAGAAIDRLEVGAGVRSTVVMADETALFTSVDGMLHRVAVTADGTFGTHQTVSFAASATGAPTVYGDTAVVGGSAADYTGVLCEIDLATMTVKRTVTVAADVKAAPLVSTGHDDGAYAYFTVNTMPGGVYAVKLGDTAETAAAIFEPTGEQANYCMASVMAAADGALYYTNDSGNLFAIAANLPAAPVEEPVEEPAEEPAAPAAGESGAVIGGCLLLAACALWVCGRVRKNG